jgi:hypothetical protein
MSFPIEYTVFECNETWTVVDDNEVGNESNMFLSEMEATDFILGQVQDGTSHITYYKTTYDRSQRVNYE